MPETMSTRRVFLLANPEKPEAEAALRDVEAFAAPYCVLVGSVLGLDGYAAIKAQADRIIVFGGDGTLIGVARSLGSNQIPLIGANVGKLGFLAEFSVDELKRVFGQAVNDDRIVTHRTMLHITVQRNDRVRGTSLATNDCVIHAGPPFRIIKLGVSINNEPFTTVSGDGLLVCTPTGSTAHNLSAGGPLLQPGVDAIVLTPINPHSLTHKPLVVERETVIDIRASAVNEGTSAIIDGQVTFPLVQGDRITVKRFSTDYLLVHNPLYAKWNNLVTKLHWGRSPNFE